MAGKNKAVKSFVWGAVTGVIAGAVTGLLFAPKPGKELRKDITVTAHKVGSKTAEISRQAGSTVQSIASKTSAFASDAKQAAGRFVTDIRSRKTDLGAVDVVPEDEIAATDDTASSTN